MSSITHLDGSIVSTLSAAKPGETVVMYLVGLGYTTPSATTGAASPAGAAYLNTPVGMEFTYNLLPGAIVPQPDAAADGAARFAGLTPGLVGIYQINFRVPFPTAGVAACTLTGPNLTIRVRSSIETIGLLDSAQICVDIGQAAKQ